ncbi:MAG: FtsH protease activity modulator HflK [Kiloniellales bacterium]|nr:FtsH protease activity modulator HflK [Kiloniellales bacterium]
MPWKSQGGGGGGNGGGPWGGGPSGGGGGGQGPWGRGSGGGGGPRPPDIDDLIRRGQDRMKSVLPSGMGGSSGFLLVIGLLIAVWLFTGFYTVKPGEQGVKLRFGEWVNQESLDPPGLHWHLPYPIETVETPQVDIVRQINVGFQRRGDGVGGKIDRAEESLMLTGDQNIIDIDFSVQWRIDNAGQFLFNIRDREATIKLAAESAMREVIGRTDIQPALSTEKENLAAETRETLQRILDEYQSGVAITAVNLQDVQPPKQVADAFEDVQRARQDQDTKINQADAYRNRIIPEARGEATRMIQGAQAYRDRMIKESQGEAERFIKVFEAYRQNPDVTRRRIYLETVQKVLQNTDKVIMDGASGAVPYLPLDQLQRRGPGAAETARNPDLKQ